jgi:hypothetical protein
MDLLKAGAYITTFYVFVATMALAAYLVMSN